MPLTVHNLPYDVIREVFQYFAQPFHLHLWHTFPWFLGHISSEWRHIFLSMTTEFWSKIKLDWKPMFRGNNIDPYYSGRQNLFKDLVAFFLSRGRGHPFSFQFHFPISITGDQWRSDWDFILHIFTKLVEQSMRWYNALIMGSDVLVSQLASVQNHIPLLKGLKLSVSAPLKTYCHRSFENAPSLTHLELSDVSTWKFQWATLTSFSFSSEVGNLAYFLHVLSQMNNLEELHVGGQPQIDQFSNAVIVFPHLIRLTVWTAEWLNAFEAPLLRDLNIGVSFNVNINHRTEGVVDFFRRSRCPLLRLQVHDCPIPVFMAIVQNAPTIVHLGVVLTMDPIDLVRCLIPREERNGECALPRLQSLRIFIWDALEEKGIETICSFVASRGRGVETKWGRALQTLCIEALAQCDVREERSWQRLSEVCESFGVELVAL